MERELAASARVLACHQQAEARGAQREQALQQLQAANLQMQEALLAAAHQPQPEPEPQPDQRQQEHEHEQEKEQEQEQEQEKEQDQEKEQYRHSI